MKLDLIVDQIINGKIYPAMAMHQASPYTQSWYEFDQHWPYTVPFRLQEYCNKSEVELVIHDIHHGVIKNSFYPIGLGFFDFSIDYFGMMSANVINAVRNKDIRILFYYHEGDNPERIKNRLDSLIALYNFPKDCYLFISGNTAADKLSNFIHFTDFELWYYCRNFNNPALPIHDDKRHHEFTVLNRLHKSWRATAMTDLLQHQLLEHSYWSYCETGTLIDQDNPIEIDKFLNLRVNTEKFLINGPYVSDTLDQHKRNDHTHLVEKYHTDSYCNIVMETHFDADQSQGTFLTEKTFKPIKHGQLFFIAGPAGSLQLLRDLGYNVFDNILDNSYDCIDDNTKRWQQLRRCITKAQPNLKKLFELAKPLLHQNQLLFLESKKQRLNTLIEKIKCK